MMELVTVVGARPQFIKASTISRRLDGAHSEELIHTGQHYDRALSSVFFDELELPEPTVNLGVGSGSHAEQTARMMTALEPVLDELSPDAVVVYGDTNSTLATALVTARQSAPLVHVEAGLRSGNRSMPEEDNRVLTDHAADLLCAPTETAVANLDAEGLADRTVLTGDVMVDALEWASVQSPPAGVQDLLDTLDESYQLLTIHRPRNTDDPERLAAIIEVLADVETATIFPAHPRTVAALESYGLREQLGNSIRLIEPQSYRGFIHLVDRADRVITDSGGVQKESFILETPCVTLRAETEWPETMIDGWNVLVDADQSRLRRALEERPPLHRSTHPFGDGAAGVAVIEAIESHLADLDEDR